MAMNKCPQSSYYRYKGQQLDYPLNNPRTGLRVTAGGYHFKMHLGKVPIFSYFFATSYRVGDPPPSLGLLFTANIKSKFLD